MKPRITRTVTGLLACVLGCQSAPTLDRTPKPITGAFVSITWRNCREDWQTTLDSYPFDTLVLGRFDAVPVDPTREILRECQMRDIQVWLQLRPGVEQAEAMEFASAPIHGWYLTEEVYGYRWPFSALAYNARTKSWTKHLKSLRNVPVMASPIPTGDDTWGTLLPGSGIDVLAIQCNNGAAGTVPSTRERDYLRIYRAAKRAGIEVWGNVESFDLAVDGVGIGNGLEPTTRARLDQRIAALSPYSSRLITFEWWHYYRYIGAGS